MSLEAQYARSDAIEAPEGRTERYIYFIQAGDRPLVKIGIAAHHPEGRLRDLQVGSPDELHFQGALYCGMSTHQEARLIEQSLHERFAKERVRGEWFNFTSELIDLARAARKHCYQICDKCGFRPVTLRKARRCVVCSWLPSVTEAGQKPPSRRELVSVMHRDGVALREIASELQVKPSTIAGDLLILDQEGLISLPLDEWLELSRRSGNRAEWKLVMAEYIGRPIREPECVLRLNGDPADNRPENLWLFPSPSALSVWRRNRERRRELSCRMAPIALAA